MGDKVGAVLQKMHESKGIKFHMSASVDSASPSASSPTKVGSIKLKDGKSIPADVVIVAVGIGPATEFLKESGFNLEKDGSLKVDKWLRVVGLPGVYATGTTTHPLSPAAFLERIDGQAILLLFRMCSRIINLLGSSIGMLPSTMVVPSQTTSSKATPSKVTPPKPLCFCCLSSLTFPVNDTNTRLHINNLLLVGPGVPTPLRRHHRHRRLRRRDNPRLH